MAQYDGSIRISTQIDSKNAAIQLQTLENRITKTADKVASLRSKMDALKDVQIPTQAYKDIETDISKAEQELGKLIEKQAQMQVQGKNNGAAWDTINQRIQAQKDYIEMAREEMQELVNTGKAFTFGSDTEQFAKLSQQISYAENDLSVLEQKYSNLQSKNEETQGSYVRLGDAVRQTFKTMARGLVDIPIATVKAGIRGLTTAFQKLGTIAKNVAVKSFKMLGNLIKSALSKVGSLIGGIISKLKNLGSTARKSFSDVNKSAKKTSGLMGTIASRFKGMALSLLLFNWITKAFNGVVKSIKDGFGNLYKDNERFKNSVDDLRASVLTLKNAFAAAFRPLVDVAIPYIQMAADKMTELLNKVGQFTAAITGQKTYTKAIKQTADAFKDAKKAAEGYLSPLDEINKYSDGKSKGEEEQTGTMFEEVPVEQKFKDMAEKVKDVFKDLFAPIKEAWNREGEFVINSWKYGLGEIKKLLKDIGRDFLKVWKQPKTIAMLQDILHIFGDIGLIVGNLAAKFREAWNTNDVGLHILENIRDIFAVIIHNIKEAADYTVEWAKTLDFTPLLQGIQRLSAALVPFFDFLSGTLADFYTEFLLPLASWTLSENGIPRLLNVLSDFMESVDWQGLRDALKNLYGALEPYAEAIGTGLIGFIERMKEYGVEFLNFLPEHINAAAESLRNSDLPGAFQEFGTICGQAVKTAFNFIKETIQSINWGEIGTLIASFINGIDWKGVGDALFGSFVAVINATIDLVYNFIVETDWRSLGEALGSSFSNALISIDWAAAGRRAGEAFKSFFSFIAETIENMDWYGIGQKVKEYLVNVDWNGVADSFFEAFGAAIGGFASFLIGLISEAWQSVVDWWHDVAYKDGQFTIQGLLDGIVDVIKTIGSWIKEHVFEPFMNGFRNAFQIHSPSKAMETIGQYIIEGLLNGLKNTWNSIASWVENKINWIKEKFSSIGEKIKGGFSGGGNGDSGRSRSVSYSMRSTVSPYAANPALMAAAQVPIPALARGAVIPPNREFLAVLGDQKSGTNIEAPLSTIEEAVINAVAKVMAAANVNGDNDRPIIIKQYLDSDIVFESVINKGKVRQMSSGNNDFLLGTT